MSNICHNCVFHEKCIMYRYNNIQTKSMKKVSRIENKDGNIVIYVEECNNFIKRKFKYTPEKLELQKNVNKIKNRG